MLEKTKGAIKNGQSRHWQHWAHKTQNEDKLKTNHRTTGAGRFPYSYLIINCKQSTKLHTSNYDGHISKYVCKIGKY
jgi:hypothetical protein